ncbi:MAG: hypothetical protein RIS64_991 [Bacteroidota bacterium]
MKSYHPIFLILFLVIHTSFIIKPKWGLQAHQNINRLAVFTLPPEMMPLYKKEIAYITEHAVDPDKRRYVSPTEGCRHYIDLDKYTFLPHNILDALALHTQIFIINQKNDTLQLTGYPNVLLRKRDFFFKSKSIKTLFKRDSLAIADTIYRQFIFQNVLKQYQDGTWVISIDSFNKLFEKERFIVKGQFKKVWAKDVLSPTGILPYHLIAMQKRLTQAFIKKNKQTVLKLSAEIGHYIADAHVPLHTTRNYDGQLTKQNGIHAFWETRLPDLFSDKYNYWVGQAAYFDKSDDYYWKIIQKSHALLPKLFEIEKETAQMFPNYKKWVSTTKNGVTLTLQTQEYAMLFHQKLDGMVEQQMRDAILAVGSAWYSAWFEAGQPNLNNLFEKMPPAKDDLPNLDTTIYHKSNIMFGRDEGKIFKE